MSTTSPHFLQGQFELCLKRAQKWSNYAYTLYLISLLCLLPVAVWSAVAGNVPVAGFCFFSITLLCTVGYLCILRSEWWQKGAMITETQLFIARNVPR